LCVTRVAAGGHASEAAGAAVLAADFDFSLRLAEDCVVAGVRAVLAASPEVHKWGIFERDPLPTWRRGRVVLLGDGK
jgi:hypothetical protein